MSSSLDLNRTVPSGAMPVPKFLGTYQGMDILNVVGCVVQRRMVKDKTPL